ncbi:MULTISPECIES: class I SAM-dependent methyltransferase [unclassified Methanoculleus]|jgi:ubiquinone/menaquinone biosynthesis C-methylase UbiE|uniref:Class I SAM-dependent methyltransferase n=1 Tax=Methanoculleus palmolei TaxID=72612 RepID=A0ABD8A8X8_9EURY|nr:class I SAM-dependent methyltransferase [Methanoculleus sp. UBA377]MDD2472688.1 class I SAM-dependent methyltransferase [Methanoculleus sp.]WOX55498.1 class I SAM-dependent methyltransferase [Methanoculleus palmolei]
MNEASDPFWKTAGDARQYDEFTRTTFAVIYPVIAGQVLERTGISRGTCLDVGSGPAPLAIALALQSDFLVTALDISPGMQSLAARNIRDRGLEGRVIPVLGDVRAIPADGETFDLVVSRGSYHFWEDLPGAFREIYRVMKPGGMAYIGGGYGSPEARESVLAGRKERGIVDDPDNPSRPRFRKFRPGEIEDSIEAAGIGDYRIINDDSGFWILFGK